MGRKLRDFRRYQGAGVDRDVIEIRRQVAHVSLPPSDEELGLPSADGVRRRHFAKRIAGDVHRQRLIGRVAYESNVRPACFWKTNDALPKDVCHCDRVPVASMNTDTVRESVEVELPNHRQTGFPC